MFFQGLVAPVIRGFDQVQEKALENRIREEVVTTPGDNKRADISENSLTDYLGNDPDPELTPEEAEEQLENARGLMNGEKEVPAPSLADENGIISDSG